MRSPGNQDACRTAHLLGEEHGAVRQLVGLGTRLLPQWDLLGQQFLPLKQRRQRVVNRHHMTGTGEEEEDEEQRIIQQASYIKSPHLHSSSVDK